MTAMRVERASAGSSFVAAAGVGQLAAFDIQLAFYALALAIIGVLVA